MLLHQMVGNHYFFNRQKQNRNRRHTVRSSSPECLVACHRDEWRDGPAKFATAKRSRVSFTEFRFKLRCPAACREELHLLHPLKHFVHGAEDHVRIQLVVASL